MNGTTKQQITALVEGLIAIRPLRDPRLAGRMALQRWILNETAAFYPNVNLVEAVTEVISPAVQAVYPR